MGSSSSSPAGGPSSRFSEKELHMIKAAFKDLGSRSRSHGQNIDRSTFLDIFPLPGLHGQRLFDLFDVKKTGFVDFEEFQDGLAICCRGSYEEKVSFLFKLYDLNFDNHISKKELATMLMHIPQYALQVLASHLKPGTIGTIVEQTLASKTASTTLSSQNSSTMESTQTTAPRTGSIKTAMDATHVIVSTDNMAASSATSTPASSVTSTPASSVTNTPASSVTNTPASSVTNTPASSAIHMTHGTRDSTWEVSTEPPPQLSPDPLHTLDLDPPPTPHAVDPLHCAPTDHPVQPTPDPLTSKSPLSFTVVDNSSPGTEPKVIRTCPPVDPVVHFTLDMLEPEDWTNSLSMRVVDKLVEHAFGFADATEVQEGLSSNTFKQWVRETPEIIQFLEAMFPLFSDNANEGVGAGSKKSVFFRPKLYRSLSTSSRSSSSTHGRNSPAGSEVVSRSPSPSRETISLVQGDTCQITKSLSHGGSIRELQNTVSAHHSSQGDLASLDSSSRTSVSQRTSASSIDQFFLDVKEMGIPESSILSSTDGGISSSDDEMSRRREYGHDLGAVCQGKLYKVGRRIHNLRSRYFVLMPKDQFLYYYRKRTDLRPAGVIFLEGCFVEPVDPSSKGDGTSSAHSRPHLLRGKPGSSSSSGNRASRSTNGLPPQNLDGGANGRASRTLSTSAVPLIRKTSSSMHFHTPKSCHGIRIIPPGDGQHRVLYAATRAERDSWLSAMKAATRTRDFPDYYTMGTKIGSGRFSTVYSCVRKERSVSPSANSPGEPMNCAVKVVVKEALNEDERELLRNEIAILKIVNQPNVVRTLEVFESPQYIYIVMERMMGGELFERIVGRSCLTEEEAHQVIKPLATGIMFLHALGVVHRDIKPENILVDETLTTVKITDFGLSKLTSPEEVMVLPCGTLSYVAPEVLRTGMGMAVPKHAADDSTKDPGNPDSELASMLPMAKQLGYGKEADLWSLGVILYLLVAGRLPFNGRSKKDTINLICNLELRWDLPPFRRMSKELHSLLDGLLCKDPKKRLTAKEVLEHPWTKQFAVSHEDVVDG